MSKAKSTEESSKLSHNYSVPSTPCMALIGWQSMEPAYITQPHPHPNHLSANFNPVLSPENVHSLFF